VKTPHHYILNLVADWKDRFAKSAKLDKFKLKADLECDEDNQIYPTTFHAYLVFLNKIAFHA
jgi:hypothetical protein